MNRNGQTPSPKTTQLVTGLFHEDNAYAVWREHGTKDDLLILTLSGSGVIGHSGGKFQTQRSDLILLKPGTPHDYGTSPKSDHWELVWTHFHPRSHWLDWLNFPEVAPGVSCLSLEGNPSGESIRDQFLLVNRLSLSSTPRSEEFAMNALELLLLLSDRENPNSGETRIDSRVALAMETLSVRYSETLSIKQLADLCDLSLSRLAHLFKEQTGVTPVQFQERQRLRRARQLLELTSRSVNSISEEIGFSSPFYFTNRFRKWTGFSPSQYRKRERSE